MYFTIQRLITFFVGLLLVAGGVLFWVNGSESTGGVIASLVLGLVGGYVVIASLVPYKNPTKEIANEVLGRVFIEIPMRLFLGVLNKLDDIF